MSLGDLTKLQAMVLCLREPPGGFCDSGCSCCCSCFPHWTSFFVSGLLFLTTSIPPWLLRSLKASTSSELCPGYFQLLYFCQAFPSHFYRERYGFVWAFFYPQTFFTLRSFPTFLTRFVTQMRAGTPHPGFPSVPALTEFSLLADSWAWTNA